MKARFIALLALLASPPVWALDSYRFAHVTIETPWIIFLGLLVVVLMPFILMAILSWFFAAKKGGDADSPEQGQ